MKKSILFIIAVVVASLYVQAQNQRQGSLDRKVLEKIKAGWKSSSAADRALQNAITHNDIKKLAKNRSNEGKVNHYFSNKVETKATTNQKSSGRCWLFTSLNVLRPIVTEKYNLPDFEFSQNYNFFYDQLEKANLFLEMIIATADRPMDDRKVNWLFHNPIGDGGQWATFNDLVKKYGLVPKEAMPETWQSEHTSTMSRLLRRKLREDGLKLRQMVKEGAKKSKIEDAKIEMMTEVYRILVLNLGEPPAEFTWQYKDKDGTVSEPKHYTPLQFYKEVVNVNVDDYVMLMNDPTRPYYKLYDIEWDRNLVEGEDWKYVNVPYDDLKNFAKQSILNNEAMYMSCDVGKQFDGKKGFLDVNTYDYDDLMGVSFGMNKAERIKTFDSGSTHGMALVGCNILPDGSIDKWLIENSWGENKGNHGFVTATDEWFQNYVMRLVVNKKYLNKKVLDVLKQKPVLLPPWDPMFLPED